jgi:hypothetical protein
MLNFILFFAMLSFIFIPFLLFLMLAFVDVLLILFFDASPFHLFLLIPLC